MQSSHAFNRNIIQLEQIIPELKDFHVHIDLENENVSYMETMVKSLENLKNTYISRNQTLKEEIQQNEKSCFEEKKQLQELEKNIMIQERINEEKKKENIQLQKNYDEVRISIFLF